MSPVLFSSMNFSLLFYQLFKRVNEIAQHLNSIGTLPVNRGTTFATELSMIEERVIESTCLATEPDIYLLTVLGT